MAERPRIVFLTHRLPYPPDKGDRIRTYHILRYLAARADVLLGSLADEPVTDEQRMHLSGLCREVCIADNISSMKWLRGIASFGSGRSISEGIFSHRELHRQLETWLTSGTVQSVLLSASSLASFAELSLAKNVPSVIDLIDVDSQKWLDYAQVLGGIKGFVYRQEAQRLRRTEMQLARACGALTLVSDAEVQLFRGFCADGDVLSIMNGVDLEYFAPTLNAISKSNCVFVGAMDYAPNVDAVVWFCREVWPDILKSQPAARFEIVGRKPTDAVQSLSRIPGVSVAGQVPDVRPYVANAAVVVAPLRIARGIQNKVLESLAMGKLVIGSPAALDGLQVTDGVNVVRADSPAEWKERLLELWRDSDRRIKLGTAGRAFVETHHSWDQCLRPFSRLLGVSEELCQPVGG